MAMAAWHTQSLGAEDIDLESSFLNPAVKSIIASFRDYHKCKSQLKIQKGMRDEPGSTNDLICGLADIDRPTLIDLETSGIESRCFSFGTESASDGAMRHRHGAWCVQIHEPLLKRQDAFEDSDDIESTVGSSNALSMSWDLEQDSEDGRSWETATLTEDGEDLLPVFRQNAFEIPSGTPFEYWSFYLEGKH